MKALSHYQKLILSELGIDQWHLRDTAREYFIDTNTLVHGESSEPESSDACAEISESTPSVVPSADAPEQAPEEVIVSSSQVATEAKRDMQQKLVLMMTQEQAQSQLVQDVISWLHPEVEFECIEPGAQVENFCLLWQVQENSEDIHYSQPELVTPNPALLSQSVKLKRLLWQRLCQASEQEQEQKQGS